MTGQLEKKFWCPLYCIMYGMSRSLVVVVYMPWVVVAVFSSSWLVLLCEKRKKGKIYLRHEYEVTLLLQGVRDWKCAGLMVANFTSILSYVFLQLLANEWMLYSKEREHYIFQLLQGYFLRIFTLHEERLFSTLVFSCLVYKWEAIF